MKYLDRIDAELRSVLDDFDSTSPMRRLLEADIDLDHYKSFLRQNFHQLRQRPLLMALAVARLQTSREAVKLLHKRAVEEVGHDLLVLNDLRALGEDPTEVPDQSPLAETTAVLAFAHYQIQQLNPVGFVGNLYFMDFAPLYSSARNADALKRIGVPAEAMSAVEDHTVVGPVHARAMKTFVSDLVEEESDVESVVYGMKTTATLYANMIQAAFDEVDRSR